MLWKCWQGSETGMHSAGRKSMNRETIADSRVKDGVPQCPREAGMEFPSAALGRQGLLGGGGVWLSLQASGSPVLAALPSGLKRTEPAHPLP